MLKFVVLTIGAFSQTGSYGVVSKYGSARMRSVSQRIGVTGSFGSQFKTFARNVRLFLLMEKYDVDLVLELLALTSANQIDFGFEEEPGCFPNNFENSIAWILRELKDAGLLILFILRFLCVIKTNDTEMEWVLPSLRQHETNIVMTV